MQLPTCFRGHDQGNLRQMKTDRGEIVVIFRGALRENASLSDYGELSARMTDIVSGLPGFISKELVSSAEGGGALIVRFENETALEVWRTHPEHVAVMQRGRDDFYASYTMLVCKVIRESSFPAN